MAWILLAGEFPSAGSYGLCPYRYELVRQNTSAVMLHKLIVAAATEGLSHHYFTAGILTQGGQISTIKMAGNPSFI